MLIKCPECDLQVSDKALSCPHCGYPLKDVSNLGKTDSNLDKKKPNLAKHRRLPNGFGQITLLKNKSLRNPYRAMVTVGIDENGRPISKPLKPKAYFRTYNDAYTALVEYNKDPFDLTATVITMNDLFKKWSEYHFKTIRSKGGRVNILAKWKYCHAMYSVPVKSIRAVQLKDYVENCYINKNGEKQYPSPGVREQIKTILNMMFDYAVENEITDRNYARVFKLDKAEETPNIKKANCHTSFTDEEMEILWRNVDAVPFVDYIVIQCYMGWRPQELCMIRLENVDLEKNIIKGGMKTVAGTDRIVPIHECIRDLVKKRYDEAVNNKSEYLFSFVGKHGEVENLTYMKYDYRYGLLLKQLGLNEGHKLHDPRKHFVTMCKANNLDEYAIKRMVGHQINDITEAVYTDRPISWYQEEIAKIPSPKI